MNQKITYLTAHGQKCYSVFSPEKAEEEQWEIIFGIQKGQGFCVDVRGNKVRLMDYYHGEARAEFEILKQEETSLPVSYDRTPVEE